MTSTNRQLRWTLIGFAGLALVALLLLTLAADDTEDWFSWTIQPSLSAAALGAFYGAALVLFIAGVRAPEGVTVRQIAPPVLAIATTLLAVTLIHLEKFDLDSVFGVFWLCAYVVAPPLILVGIWRGRKAAGTRPEGPELPPALSLALAMEGVALALTSAMLLFSPETANDLWPWQLTPLVARAFGAFTFGVALVALIVARDGVIGAMGIAAAYATLGALQLLVVGIHAGDLGDREVATAIYVAFWGAVLVTGVYGLSSAARALSR
jgi:hypothetical protein